MKLSFALLALAGCALSGQAFAQANCGGSGTRGTNSTLKQTLTSELSGNTVCASRNGDRWQEFHGSDGKVTDYKRGPNDPVDPSEVVGTWSVTGTATNTVVVYNYGSGGTYSYAVWRDTASGIYHFCGVANGTVSYNGNNVTNAQLQTGLSRCP